MIEAILMGISLAACAGFRVFLPLLAVGVVSRLNAWEAAPLVGWTASNEGLILLGVAAVIESIGDKIPFIDNLLDTAETFVRPAAGALAAFGVIHHISPEMAGAVALILGAPLAGGVHFAGASARAASSATTAGAANPVLSFLEDLITILWVVLTVVVPILAGVFVLLAVFWIARRLRRRRPHPAV